MIVNDVEQRVVHRLPVAKRAKDAEVRCRIGQPTGAGTFPLDRIRAEEAVHLMLVVCSRAPMCPVVGHRTRVAPVTLMLARCAFRFSAVLMAAVILVFFGGFLLFRAHHAAVLIGLMALALLALTLFEFFQDVLRFPDAWAEITKRK